MSGRGVERIPFEVDVNRVIEVLAKQIYQTPLALLRENAQNAFDAILLRRHAGQEFEPRITVTITDQEISIADNGIGMTPDDLRNHYWHAGSSGKNNAEARAAGVVGTFGIGAMANFGIADALELETESARSTERTNSSAQRDTLSATEDCIEIAPAEPTGEPGTLVRARMAPGSVNVAEAVAYIASFVNLVDIPVLVNGELVSQQGLEGQVVPPAEAADIDAGQIEARLAGAVRMRVTAAGAVWVHLGDLSFDGEPIAGEIALSQGVNAIHTYRSGFGLAVASANSFYNFGGAANVEIFEPTAGREALTTASMQVLQECITALDALVSRTLAPLSQSNLSAPFMRWALQHDQIELCTELLARVEPGSQQLALKQIGEQSQERRARYFAGSDQTMITAMASEDSPLIVLATTNPRRQIERRYLERFCDAEELTDEPSLIEAKPTSQWSMAEGAIVFRVGTVLASDYFLTVEVGLGRLSHDLPALIESEHQPARLILDPDAPTFGLIVGLYADDYPMFGSMVKDFVRNVVFPLVSELVPSSTREGAEAFLKSIRRTRDYFEYETEDLLSLTEIWDEFREGRISVDEATQRSIGAAGRGIQVFEPSAAQNVAEVVPDLGAMEAVPQETEPGPAPPILRSETATEAKLLLVTEDAPAIHGYRCFIALSDRALKERGEFFHQPHSTSIVWGGQKVLFVFEHHSGQFGLYYDLQATHVVAPESGGGPFATATIVLRDKIFIPVPPTLADKFIPSEAERKRFEVRCDLLFTDSERQSGDP